MKNKILYIVRGLPGSGKSTFAKSLNIPYFEADMFFIRGNGEYAFDPILLPKAHNWCKNTVREAMLSQDPEFDRICVSNTFTQEWEMDPYFKMASENGYNVISIVIENRHSGKNIHDVPNESIEKMKNRFQLKLR